MSALYLFPPEQEPQEDTDLQAAIYALGVLDAGDAAAIRLRSDTDPALQNAIGTWNARLALLTEVLHQATPPAQLWTSLATDAGIAITQPEPVVPPAAAVPEPPATEIEIEIEIPPPPQNPAPTLTMPIEPPPPPRPYTPPAYDPEPAPTPLVSPAPLPPTRSGGLFMPLAVPPDAPPAPPPARTKPTQPWHTRLLIWQTATAIAAAAAILLAVLTLMRPTATRAIAAIGPASAPAPLFLAELDTAGHLIITPLATIAVPAGRDLELWRLAPNSPDRPTSLGILPAGGRSFTLPPSIPEGTQLLITMEPRGGAATGVLTSPVLYGGTLANH